MVKKDAGTAGQGRGGMVPDPSGSGSDEEVREAVTEAQAATSNEISLDDEHRLLVEEHQALQQEHAILEAHPEDIDGHEAHKDKLREHIQKLHLHIARMRHIGP